MFKTLIKPAELLQNISNANWRIFDVRFFLNNPDQGYQDYLSAHIPGSIYLHLDNDLSGEIIPGKTGRHPLPSPPELESRFSRWGISSDIQVVVYDQFHGGIAARLWWMLNWLGHQKVAVLDGGYMAWKELNYPVTEVIPEIPAARFTINDSLYQTLDAEQVLTNIKSGDQVLIDSRIHPRYLGKIEPIDPVAGHIPGALNLPFLDHVSEGKGWKSATEIKSNFDTVLDNLDRSEVIFYCGSGVTACHNLLAYTHAGLGTGILYPGSWSDWITDPQRPIIAEDA